MNLLSICYYSCNVIPTEIGYRLVGLFLFYFVWVWWTTNFHTLWWWEQYSLQLVT